MRRRLTPEARARGLGALLLIVAFISGLLAGRLWFGPGQGVGEINVNVRMSTELPRELRRLDLSPAQQDTLRRVLLDGQRRTLSLLRDFEPRLRASIDSVDAEVHSVLTPAQRLRLDASRTRAPGAFEREVDTVRR